MTKTTTNGSCNFHATVPTYTKPKVIDKYMDDEGEEVYVLDNNRTSLASKYNQLWNPIRSEINWKSKGENPDKTKIK